ncbi:MAG: flagellar hook capping FlgD N-terminal domain-containing protein [Acidobacteriaceae bacterium]
MNIQGFSPSITAPEQSANANAATATANASTSTTSTTPTGDSATSLQDTFLNLLVTELQNQDPTQPVDPTTMVGQLVSLNQLDQLISINQTLTSMAPTSSATTGAATADATTAAGGTGATSASSDAQTNPTLAAASALAQMQSINASSANAAALMNLYGSMTPSAQTSNITTLGGR